MIPKTIGRYRIKAELGRGGMSTVYLAHDPRFERDVAVKLLPLELLHQPTFRRRFEREAKVVASLDHPALVPVYDFGEENGQPFLVMRFMTGGSLGERLKQGAISIAESARIINKLAPALDEVHKQGIIHRDLKPSNILFDQRNEPYISDFGTAKLKYAHTKLTDTGGAVGTPAYMSPEQIQGDGELDSRSDIYTLGVILFEMLTGKHPYQTNTPIAVAVKHMFEPIPKLQETEPNLPPDLQELIVRAMAKRREDRYRTTVEFAKAIDEVAQQPAEFQGLTQVQKAPGQRFALIIANYEHDDPTLAQLMKPTADVHTLAYVLQSPAVGGFGEVHMLINESAAGVRRSISQFYADRTPDDLLLLYFIGHAALGTHGHLYLAVKDTDHELLRGTAVPVRFIADEMDQSLCEQQILVMDCSFSDTICTESSFTIGRDVNTSDTFGRHGVNRVVVTANDSTQYSWANGTVIGQAEPSLFTEHFVQGLLSGAADADHDGKITIDDLFDYVTQQLKERSLKPPGQIPRRWSPFAYQTSAEMVIARNPNYSLTQTGENENDSLAAIERAQENRSVPEKPAPPSMSWLVRRPALWLAGLAMLATIVIVMLAGQPWEVDAEYLALAPTSSQTAVLTQTSSQATVIQVTTPAAKTSTIVRSGPTTASSPTATASPSPTAATLQTATPLPESTAAPTAILSETDIPEAVALLSSSLFLEPDSNAQEITFIGPGDVVSVLGRSEFGSWLYVQIEAGQAGFVYRPRLDWAGNYDALPVITGTAISNSGSISAGHCTPAACPPLTITLYPLPGTRCENNRKYRTVYIQGTGGNGRYTYFWDNQQLAGPIEDGYGFEVSSVDGSVVIGTGKILSEDGQIAEKELYVADFICH